MFGRVVDAVVSIFKSQPAEAPGREVLSENRPLSSRPTRSGESAFASRLQSMVEGEDAERALVAGSLELVGLEELRKALGKKWALVADRVNDLAELELQMQLDPADFYRQYDDTLFLVCFSNLDKEAAEQKAKQIRARIKAALVQHIPEIAHAIDVDLMVAEVDRGGLRQGDVPIANSLFASLQKVRAEAQHTALDFKSLLFRDMQVVFSPAWHTGKHMVVFNRCVLDTASGSASMARFQALADTRELGRMLAELDFLILTRSIEALHQMLQLKRSCIFLVPVMYRTISEPGTLREYLQLLALMPDSYRKFVIIEICDIPSATTPRRLGELSKVLGAFAKGLSLELPLDYPRLPAVMEQYPWAVAVSLVGAHGNSVQLAARLRLFVSAALNTGTRTLAHCANSVGSATAAVEAGFTYIDGPAIHPTMRDPKPPSALNPFQTTVSPALKTMRQR